MSTDQRSARAKVQSKPASRPAWRGLLLGFVLTFLNLVGAFLTIAALGGLGEWTEWQFVGVFALFETATGTAYIVAPNIWRLPISEANTSDATTIHLAASAIFIPHWAAGAKALAGAGLLLFAASRTGIGVASAVVPLLILLVAGAVIGLSLLAARFGVVRPDLDVVFIVVKRPRRDDLALPGISLTASLLQVLTNIGAYPAVKALSPSTLYGPEMRPSLTVFVVSLFTTAILLAAGFLVWRGRISWRAPREQQRDAEEFA